MTVLRVHRFPDPVLKQKAREVTVFDDGLKSLADNMLETMYVEGGIGLAANQVGETLRLIVTDLRNDDEEFADLPRPERPAEPRVYVNPRLLEAWGEIVTEEGCLSVADFTAEVKRADKIKVAYRTLEGGHGEEILEGLAAVCLQHEMDHLHGKLFIDHLSPLKRQMVKKRLTKLARLDKSA